MMFLTLLISYLRLKNALVFNNFVKPIHLPDKDTMNQITKATVVGWGGILPWVNISEEKFTYDDDDDDDVHI